MIAFKNYLIISILTIYSSVLMAQENEVEPELIDASKPTNFYSMLDNTLEYTMHSTDENEQNVFGYRGKLVLALSEEHLVLIELPLLFNDRTSKFGIGDVRARYFWLPYKNYEKILGAFGPSLDVFAPTGSFENGLGTGRWIVSPGITVGIMAAEWIQFFPILSYQYASKPVYDNPIPDLDKATHGVSFQVISPVVFSEKFFVQITPILKINDFNDEKSTRFEQEFSASYFLTSSMQLSGFYNGKFEDKIHTVSLGLTIFL